MKLKDKVAIVTGSAKSIGKATAVKFAAEGAKVVIVDMDQAAIDSTVAEIKASGAEVLGFKVNVTKKAEIEAMVAAVKQAWGRIDVLVNNAGIIQDAQLYKMTDDQFDNVIDVNLRGVYLCTKAVVDTMIEQKSGVILVTSSIVGLYGNFGQTNYAATKWGVIGMVKTWAKELGKKGIRANAVCPGFIDTPILAPMPEKVIEAMTAKSPLGRLGKPEDIANAFAFLASDEANYSTGIALEVGGGVVI